MENITDPKSTIELNDNELSSVNGGMYISSDYMYLYDGDCFEFDNHRLQVIGNYCFALNELKTTDQGVRVFYYDDFTEGVKEPAFFQMFASCWVGNKVW